MHIDDSQLQTDVNANPFGNDVQLSIVVVSIKKLSPCSLISNKMGIRKFIFTQTYRVLHRYLWARIYNLEFQVMPMYALITSSTPAIEESEILYQK